MEYEPIPLAKFIIGLSLKGVPTHKIYEALGRLGRSEELVKFLQLDEIEIGRYDWEEEEWGGNDSESLLY